MKINILCALAGLLLSTSCKKTDVKTYSSTNTTYSGVFISTDTNPAINYQAVTGNVTLVLSGSNYSCSSPTIQFPAAAKGSFSINDQQYIFRDSTIHTANFDGQIVLTGTYNAVVKGDSLFLKKTVNTAIYTYKLKKQ